MENTLANNQSDVSKYSCTINMRIFIILSIVLSILRARLKVLCCGDVQTHIECLLQVISSAWYDQHVTAPLSTEEKVFWNATSVAVLAEISLRSPRKLFIFIIKKYIYRIEVSKNQFILFWKKLHWMQHPSNKCGYCIRAIGCIRTKVCTAGKAFPRLKLNVFLETLIL